MKPTLEEYVTNLKAELKKEIAKREDSEYRHAVACEALEFYAERNNYYIRPMGHGFLPSIVTQDNGFKAYQALNGVVDSDG